MKIVYCIDTLDYIGGTERITIVKANALSEIEGNEVYIVVGFNRKGNEIIGLSPKVKLVDLTVPYFSNYGNNWMKASWIYIKLRKEHLQKLELVLNSILPDIVISVGGAEKLYLPRLKVSTNPVFIREMHFYKYYRRGYANTIFDKILSLIIEFIDYRLYINKYDCIAVLTQEDYRDNWKNNHKVVVIPNPISWEMPDFSSLDNKVVISAGRLVKVKNFTSMISTWRYVNESFPAWKLEIYGDGPCRQELQKQIEDMNLSESVFLCGSTTEIHSKMSNSSIFAFTSTVEGFPLVFLEAMSHGLPVVSYDCPTGPKDIIEQGKNGFYVTLNDEYSLAEKLKLLIGNEKLRKEMGRNAFVRSKDFSMNKIIALWMSVFNNLLSTKKNSC